VRNFFTKEQILRFPEKHLPLIVLSDNVTSFFAWGIRAHQKGNYNHMMWMHRPGCLASQDWIFKEVPAWKYLQGEHRLKFWTNSKWPQWKRIILKALIKSDLKKPAYKRLYDPVQIIGKLIHCDWLQIPGLDICSDKAKYLKKIDPMCDLKHPSPTGVNLWLKEWDQRKRGYHVYGRYIPD